MTCNLTGGRIYKGSIAEITVPMFPRCYTGSTDELVVDFYTTRGGTSIEYSVSAGTIELDGVNGTVVFQVPQLGVLDDGNLRYTTRCGDDYSMDWQSRWFVVTPNDFTPVEYITNENVEQVVEGMMVDYLTITAASDTYATKQMLTAATSGLTTSAQVQSIVTAATTGFTTTAQVESIVTAATTGFTTTAQVQSMVTAATSGLVSTTDLETTLQDYAKLTDIPDVSVYATQSQLSAATQNMVTSSTITNIWVGTQTQYDQIPNKDNATLYIIK